MTQYIKKDNFLLDIWNSLVGNKDLPKNSEYDVYDLTLGKPIHLMRTNHEWPIYATIAYELRAMKPSILEHIEYEIMVR